MESHSRTDDADVASAPALGALLRRFRQRAGLTQEELAERAGLSVQAIGALETGKRRRPYPHTVRTLAAALDLSAAERADLVAATAHFDAGDPASPASPHATLLQTLPAPPTPIVGREREEAAAANLLVRADVRLLTLTGPGGVGKTRLAIQVAEGLGDRFAAVCFVGLGSLTDPALVPAAVAHALGLRERGGRASLADEVIAVLRDQRVLLLLDNFEHLTAASPFVSDLLARCPDLKLLVTSRTPLRLRGEHELSVPPLAIPPAANAAPADLLGYPAVRLFADRARAVDPSFVLETANAEAVAQICVRLDGLPLAIELAAARTHILPPPALLTRLSHRLGVLTGGAADAPTRQRTMRDAIAWSYDLLAPNEQSLFRRLAVFAGGFTLEAAEAVGGKGGKGDRGGEEHATSRTGSETTSDGSVLSPYPPTPLPPSSVLDLIASLVDKSLLRRLDGEGDEPRFTMLATIQEYGLERLAAAGEAEAVRLAHADGVLALATAAEPWLRGPRQVAWLDQLEAEIDNIREALRFCHERLDADRGLRLASALQWFWWDRGYLREGREWLTAFLNLGGTAAPAIRATALNGASYLAGSCGEFDAAVALAEESLTLALGAGDAEGVAWSRAYLAAAQYRRGDVLAAGAAGEQSLAAFRALDRPDGILFAICYVGLARQDRGDDAAARLLLEEGIALGRRLGEHDSLSRALLGLGFMALYNQGDAASALACFTESLALAAELGHPYPLIYSLEGLAGVAAATARPARACRLAAAAAACRETRHAIPAPQLLAKHQRLLDSARAALPEETFRLCWAQGRAMTLDQAIAAARCDSD